MSAFPPPSVLASFSLHGEPIPLEGGLTQSYRVGSVVLKPVDNVEETQYISDLHRRLIALANPKYRLAEPLTTASGAYVANGWNAVRFIAGKTAPLGRWGELLDASRAFHGDLKTLVPVAPGFIARRTHRWALADRIVWGEVGVEDTHVAIHAPLRALLDRFLHLRQELDPEDAQCQLVHGDLEGNVMFCEKEVGLAPGIIDLSMYWRPVAFAEAMVVADALTDCEEGPEMMRLTGTSRIRVQMLIRALSFRLISDSINAVNNPPRAKEIEEVFERAYDYVSSLRE